MPAYRFRVPKARFSSRDLPQRLPCIGRLRVDRVLPGAFILLSYLDLARMPTDVLGNDARLYYRAAVAFRGGLSPWDAFTASSSGQEWHFASLPPTILAFVPFTAIPERLFVWVWVFLTIGASLWVIRTLHLKWWWLLFPPLMEGIYVANPQIVLLALLLSGYAVLAALAPVLKIYALAPIVSRLRVREILLTIFFLAASLVLLPGLWSEYLSRSGGIAARDFAESGGGYGAFGSAVPVLVIAVVGIAALALVDVKQAGWLIAPALVPASQFHLSTMAMPVLAEPAPVVLFIVAMAVPVHGVPPAAIGLYGMWRGWRAVRSRGQTMAGTRGE